MPQYSSEFYTEYKTYFRISKLAYNQIKNYISKVTKYTSKPIQNYLKKNFIPKTKELLFSKFDIEGPKVAKNECG